MKVLNERKKAEALLADSFSEKQYVIEEIFLIIDSCIELFENKADNSTYHRICGLTTLKAKNLGHGIYSLILDGLGQEAGALARPFLEYYELLIYFRLNPERVAEAIDRKLPPAGKIAKKIEGNFKEFRSYLNENASHSSYSYYSLNHLLEKPKFKFKKYQKMIPSVLDRNLGDLFAQLILVSVEAINALQTKDLGIADHLAEKMDCCRLKGAEAFNYAKRLGGE